MEAEIDEGSMEPRKRTDEIRPRQQSAAAPAITQKMSRLLFRAEDRKL
jgi:hypothetical protein